MAALGVLRNYEEDVCLRLMLESSLVHMLSEACKVVLEVLPHKLQPLRRRRGHGDHGEEEVLKLHRPRRSPVERLHLQLAGGGAAHGLQHLPSLGIRLSVGEERADGGVFSLAAIAQGGGEDHGAQLRRAGGGVVRGVAHRLEALLGSCALAG